jgi:hypothetical protein
MNHAAKTFGEKDNCSWAAWVVLNVIGEVT